MRGGRPAVAAAAVLQLGAGLLVMIGLATPLVAMVVVGVMAVATSVHLGKGFWEQSGGFEYALFLTLGALVPLWAGSGRWSVDRLLGIGGPLAGGWALGATVLTIVVSTGREARLRDHAAVRARRCR